MGDRAKCLKEWVTERRKRISPGSQTPYPDIYTHAQRVELTRVYLPKVRHRQTFEAANFCTPLGQGGSILSAQMSVYGALLIWNFPRWGN